jgi:hypothetical protein
VFLSSVFHNVCSLGLGQVLARPQCRLAAGEQVSQLVSSSQKEVWYSDKHSEHEGIWDLSVQERCDIFRVCTI